MKNLILILLSFIISFISSAQTTIVNIEKKEMQIQGGGYASFSILNKNPSLEFNPEKTYFWFNKFSGIQSTKGGAGGQLLHGKFQQFFSDGKLNVEMNFNYGLKNGEVKEWDKEGALVTDSKYDNDQIVYTKFKSKEGYYIEWIGELFKKGSVKNTYAENGLQLIQRDQLIEDIKAIVTIYYSYPKGAIQSSYVGSILSDLKYGYYKAYFKNGQIHIDGDYENTNRVGTWKYYDEFGNLKSTESYRVNKEYYPNGKIKIEGGECLNSTSNTWIKHGYWWYYNPEGDSDLKVYNLGIETNKIENY